MKIKAMTNTQIRILRHLRASVKGLRIEAIVYRVWPGTVQPATKCEAALKHLDGLIAHGWAQECGGFYFATGKQINLTQKDRPIMLGLA